MSLYEDLGVPRDASAEEIKRAYRRKAHKAHPDKGGSEGEFHAVTRAYDVLSDPERRERYDRTGDDARFDPRNLAIGTLAQIMASLYRQVDPDRMNILVLVKQHIDGEVAKLNGLIAECRREIRVREKALKRLKRRKAGGESILEQITRGGITDKQREIEGAQQKIALSNDMLAIVAQYEYECDEQTRPFTPPAGGIFMWNR